MKRRRLTQGTSGGRVRRFQRAANARLRARGLGRYAVKVDGRVGSTTLRAARKAAWYLGLDPWHRNQAKDRGLITARLERVVRGQENRTRRERRVGRKRLKRLVQARARRRAAGERMSKHFHVREFHCRNGARVPRAAYPALRALCRDYLEPARSRFGAVTVFSGFRTRVYNAGVGGAINSQHIYDASPAGVAADIGARGGSPRQVADFLERLRPGGLGRYPTFTHVDNRQREGEPRAHWGRN